MKSFNKKVAFTLAEIMVTMALLGVIAAMTVPTLTYNYKGKVLEQQFRSTYAELREIAARINIQRGDVGEYSRKSNFQAWDREFMSYLGGSKISNAAAGGESIYKALADFYKNAGTPQGPYRFTMNTGRSVICDNDGIWLDNKGRVWTFNAENRFACVDINGAAPPNRINVDIFAFKPMSAKEMAVWHYNDTLAHSDNYSGSFVPCDLDRLSGGGSPNGNYVNNNICPGSGCCNSGTVYPYVKGSGTGVDACPFNEPIENIAPMKKDAAGNVVGEGKSSRGKKMTTSNNYWKDYIHYR